MSAVRSMLVDAAARLLGDVCTDQVFAQAERGALVPALWQALENSGLTEVGVPGADGIQETDLGDVLAVLREAGRHCLPAPLAETMLARRMAAAAGLPSLAGPASIGPVLDCDSLRLEKHDQGWTLHGTLRRIPWGRHAQTLCLVADFQGQPTCVLVRGAVPQTLHHSIANEPRDDFHFDGLVLAEADVGVPGQGWTAADLRFAGALYRCAVMAGAMQSALAMSVRYAMDRVQFGRPIGQFQAVQQQLADMAGQVAAASAAAHAAGLAAERGSARFDIAAAKLRVGEAAHRSAQIAHAVHGAIGFTLEYALQRRTRRLWCWREEFGTDRQWARWLGRVAGRVGGDGLWPFITASEHPVDFP